MRTFSDIITEFRKRPLSYWFGFSPPCSYKLSEGCIVKQIGNTNSEFARLASITSWKNMGGHSIAVRFADHTVIVVDKTGTLRSIVESAIGECEKRGTDV